VSSLDLARLQFGSTSIYHFLFVPVSIGLAFLVALLQTGWYRKGDETYLRLARFFGALLLINVAIGVVTGLIQEFEFGMNWSTYSKLVGNVFGGPLAFEGLGAFFLESTFLGLWIFGWNRLSKRAHLACIWTVAFGTILSAAFIMAANSWMQHPVGYKLNSAGQPELTNIFALFTNPVFLWSFAHVVLASLVTGAVIMLGVSAWQMRHGQEATAFRRTAVISLVLLLFSTPLNIFVGSELGVIEGTYQPMKIAAAEALTNTCDSHCPFSAFQIGGGNNDDAPTQIINIPDLLSILATNSVDGEVQGTKQLNAEYQKEFGPGNYVPNVFVQYWSMRVMAYLATLLFGFALWGAWLLYRHKLDTSRWFLRIAPWVVIGPFLINTAGWMLTENGRQPWIVQGLMKTANGVSPSVSSTEIWISLIVFYVIFIAFGIADAWLMIRFGRKPLDHDPIAKLTEGGPPGDDETSDHDEPALVY
jgi:cytochrome d ubiquinol oxidase subunit I